MLAVSTTAGRNRVTGSNGSYVLDCKRNIPIATCPGLTEFESERVLEYFTRAHRAVRDRLVDGDFPRFPPRSPVYDIVFYLGFDLRQGNSHLARTVINDPSRCREIDRGFMGNVFNVVRVVWLSDFLSVWRVLLEALFSGESKFIGFIRRKLVIRIAG